MTLMEIGAAKIKGRREGRLELDNRLNKGKKIRLAYWSSFTINEIVKQSK